MTLRFAILLLAIAILSGCAAPERADATLKTTEAGAVVLACERSGTIEPIGEEIVDVRIENFANAVCRGAYQIDDSRAVEEIFERGPDIYTIKAHFSCTDGRKADILSSASGLCGLLLSSSDDTYEGLR